MGIRWRWRCWHEWAAKGFQVVFCAKKAAFRQELKPRFGQVLPRDGGSAADGSFNQLLRNLQKASLRIKKKSCRTYRKTKLEAPSAGSQQQWEGKKIEVGGFWLQGRQTHHVLPGFHVSPLSMGRTENPLRCLSARGTFHTRLNVQKKS